MPIYEYQCGACKHKFEIIQKVTDDLLTQCPECKKQELRKLVTAAAFRLKGSGWYETDFKDKKSKKAAEGDNKAGSSADKDKASDSGADKQGSGSAAGGESSDKSTKTTASPPAASKSSSD
ncbi:MAG: zinc ribbon domain-containing protein [Gammaproteobacteria bacterium]